MPDLRLVVTELDASDANYGKMFGVPPNRATGVPIPAFRTGPTVPTIGQITGEGFYATTTQKGFVWDGSAWLEIAASPIKLFNTEALLLADTTTATGKFAVAADTGGLFIKQPTGWLGVGVKDYASVALLLAANPAVGTLAVATDEGSLWQMLATGWRALVMRELADTAAVQAWAIGGPNGGHVGDQALDLAHSVVYVRTTGGWKPTTLWEDTEANIRASTWALNGQEAISTDTGRTFARISGNWVEEPVQHYATEAALLAATPPNGTLAWADDTNIVFTRAAAAWHRIAGAQLTVAAAAPATPAAGDLFVDTTNNRLSYGTAAGAWQPVGSVLANIVSITQTDYTALSVKDPNTLYVIRA